MKYSKLILSRFSYRFLTSVKMDVLPLFIKNQLTEGEFKFAQLWAEFLFAIFLAILNEPKENSWSCYAVVPPASDYNVCVRCNQLSSYFETNKQAWTLIKFVKRLAFAIGMWTILVAQFHPIIFWKRRISSICICCQTWSPGDISSLPVRFFNYF